MNKNILTPNILLLNQIDILFRSAFSGSLSSIVSVWLVFVLVHETQHNTNALLLAIGVTSLSLIRGLITNSYLKTKSSGLNKHLSGYLFLTFLISLACAAFILTISSDSEDSVRNMVFLINFGLIAGSIPILSVWLPAYFVYAIPKSIAIFIVFMNLDYEGHYYISLTFLIFTAVMISTSIKVNRSRKKEIELTLYNESLITDLNEEIHIREETQLELENNKRKLEMKVEERTKDLVAINSNLEKVIEKKEQAEESLQYLAYHDELTGLPNRNLLINRIDHSIQTANRNKQQMGILFIDLDRFKTINDSLGHNIGDRLIKEVSLRLLNTIRKEDTISRNGGDEFVVVIQHMLNSDEVIGIAKKLIANLTNIFEIDSHKVHIGASIGISLYPGDGETALELIRNADTAMFSAKKSGGNRLQFYDESMSNRLHERLTLEAELHLALARGEFYMMYQPQVDCITGETTGFEALLRWKNKKLGLVGPHHFVPLLEETGLIYDVGNWVVKEVSQFIASGRACDAVIAINLSALQCGDMEFVKFIRDTIKDAGISAKQLEFEITESLLINDFEKTQIFLKELNALGCSIALDDFGTGYTSMSYLTRLPIDCIKVDQSFIRDIDSSATLENIVKAIVNMSASLGIRNIFEGVETLAELDVVNKLNGRVVQGYLYSRPLNVEDIDEWMTNEHKCVANYN